MKTAESTFFNASTMQESFYTVFIRGAVSKDDAISH